MIKADLRWLQNTLALSSNEVENLDEKSALQLIDYVSTDSRTIQADQVFVALKGPNFDGSKFIAEVKEKGAIAVVTEQLVDVDIPQFKVPNALRAYGQIAAAVAQQSNVKTIAITGSVGKTSVKEMCLAILSHKVKAKDGKVLATQGNFNNEVGVPHTLMRFSNDLDYAVVELGANHIGEIAYTTSLTQPDVAVLNNVGEAHLEGFGSLMGVVQAKGEIFQGLSDSGIAIVNGDSEYKAHWLSNLEKQFDKPEQHIIQFSTDVTNLNKPGFVVSTNVELNRLGCPTFDLTYNNQTVTIKLPIPGRHNVANALSAAAACIAIGASLEDVQLGLASMTPVSGRVTLHEVSERLLVIDDSYNANVRSVNAASDLLSSYQGTSILVLGDMAELGDEGVALHQQVGEHALRTGVDVLLSFGDLSRHASEVFQTAKTSSGMHFEQHASLLSELEKRISQTSEPVSVLVKGSRSAKMEVVVAELIKNNNNVSRNNG
ncbi:MAG: UDP-N-acetylmuramoyl-tripeptide--D-alanyl-D-alanine ligase [Gammaproteobacteria bacterium]|nr:UDP-N-acetylmuramoyl-tripeptide--D-alanyl-D-alanine ligase [Gammaproteobacteria bacterium]